MTFAWKNTVKNKLKRNKMVSEVLLVLHGKKMEAELISVTYRRTNFPYK